MTNRIFRLNTELNCPVKRIFLIMPLSVPHSLVPWPPVYLFTCFHFSSLSIVYLLRSWRPTCHQQTYLCLMAVGAFSTRPAADRRPGGLRGEQREGLSGQAGLLSITMPIETAAQGPVLLGQIRPPDRAALESDPTHRSGGDRQYVTKQLPPLFIPSCWICPRNMSFF